MKHIIPPLTVEEKVRVELSAHQDENPGVPISIAEICRRANVSRANLYEFHRPLIKEIVGAKVLIVKSEKSSPASRDDAVVISELTRRNQALLLLCLELTRELQLVRARLEQVKSKKR